MVTNYPKNGNLWMAPISRHFCWMNERHAHMQKLPLHNTLLFAAINASETLDELLLRYVGRMCGHSSYSDTYE